MHELQHTYAKKIFSKLQYLDRRNFKLVKLFNEFNNVIHYTRVIKYYTETETLYALPKYFEEPDFFLLKQTFFVYIYKI